MKNNLNISATPKNPTKKQSQCEKILGRTHIQNIVHRLHIQIYINRNG